MDGRVLELVLLLVVKDQAMLFDVAHDWCLPSWALEECDQTVEDPILCTEQCQQNQRLVRGQIVLTCSPSTIGSLICGDASAIALFSSCFLLTCQSKYFSIESPVKRLNLSFSFVNLK